MKISLLMLRITVVVAVLAACGLWASSTRAFEVYSETGNDGTNCSGCHGDFRSNSYVSLADGQNWGNLHNIHRFDMLNGDCATCHPPAFFPLFLADSEGGDGLESVGCVGCHGRTEDDGPGNPSFLGGLGAGLRQHHHNSGITLCSNCHDDADPALYTPVGEEVLPPYYANPGNGHPNIPVGPCDPTENFAGNTDGLDNDGDGLYDANDPDCEPPVPTETASWGKVKALYRALLP